MKRALSLTIAALALAGLVLAGATAAVATPGKTTACSKCHHLKSTVHLSVKKVSSTSTTVTYKVGVTGGKGITAWAVLSGGKNLKHRNASTGTFTVAKGKAIKVYGVKTRTGSAVRSFTSK
jgi:hypothetical protein